MRTPQRSATSADAVHRLQRHHARAVFVTAGADLFGDVAHFERMRVHALLGDESAAAGHALEHPFAGQLAQRAVHRHARDRQLPYELVLGGHPLARPQRAGGDALEDVMLDLQVAGGGLGQGHGRCQLS